MNQMYITVGMLLGGLGLFMLSVNMITDGLKLAAGKALRHLLGKWTLSPQRGILTGMAITGLVQSSSAVTVATIGFVNAGLLPMQNALGVVYGANIGTTMTGWLVAIVGFKFKIEAFALPLIGIGMLLRLTGGASRSASLGIAIAGFGLFFIGIDALKDAFEGLVILIDLQKLTIDGITGVLFYLALGFMMTVLTQSSSAAIALILTAATGGVVGLYAAASMVVGANIGTTSTAAIAVIGATSNAKRVAAAHVVFNLITGIVALIFLPILFLIIRFLGKTLGLEDIPAVTLALFHTAFNVLGVILMLPITGRLSKFLETRFVTQEEVESRPQYLDKTVAVTPSLAINALTLEFSRIVDVVRRMTFAVLDTQSMAKNKIANDHAVVEKLTQAIADFITKLERDRLTSETAKQLALLLRTQQHLLACTEQALEITNIQASFDSRDSTTTIEGNLQYRKEIKTLLQLANAFDEKFELSACEQQLESTQRVYDTTKEAILIAGAEKTLTVENTIAFTELNSHIRRMARQFVKATICLNEVQTELKPLKANAA